MSAHLPLKRLQRAALQSVKSRLPSSHALRMVMILYPGDFVIIARHSAKSIQTVGRCPRRVVSTCRISCGQHYEEEAVRVPPAPRPTEYEVAASTKIVVATDKCSTLGNTLALLDMG